MNLTEENIGWVILVIVLAIPQLMKAVTWVLKVVKANKQSHQESFDAGQRAQAESDEVEERFNTSEEKINKLMNEERSILETLSRIQQSLEWLNESDNLNIKYVIKRSWEKSVVDGEPLDHYEFDLLEHRYSIYKLRGGNSWAEGMMADIRTARHNQVQNQQKIDL